MTEMTLYWCPQTRASRAVWMLEEAGAPYTLAKIDIRSDAAKEDKEFREASPMGKVPALRHGDVMVTDSAAVCMYIAEQFPGAGLAPDIGDPKRAQYLQWMIFAPGYIEPAMTEAFGSTQPNRVAHGWGDFLSTIDMLRGGLQNGPWLLGEQFSAADVMVGSAANFMKMFGILPEHQDLHDYIDRCAARPAFQKAMSMDAEAPDA